MFLREVLLTINSRSTYTYKCWCDFEVDSRHMSPLISHSPAMTDTQRHSLTERYRQRALNPHLNLLLPSHRFFSSFFALCSSFNFICCYHATFFIAVSAFKRIFSLFEPKWDRKLARWSSSSPGCVRLNFGSRSFCCWCLKAIPRDSDKTIHLMTKLSIAEYGERKRLCCRNILRDIWSHSFNEVPVLFPPDE